MLFNLGCSCLCEDPLLFVGGELGTERLTAFLQSDGSRQWGEAFSSIVSSASDDVAYLSCNSSADAYVAVRVGGTLKLRKLNSEGDIDPGITINLSALADHKQLTVDSSGNIYVGYSSGVWRYRKYNSDGTLAWTRSTGFAEGISGLVLTKDSSQIVATFDSSPSTSSADDLFEVRNTSDGSLADTISNDPVVSHQTVSTRPAIDSNGDVLLAVFEEPNGIGNSPSNNYVKKFQIDGTHVWTTFIETGTSRKSKDLVVDANGNVIVANAIGTRKYNSSGTLQWTDSTAAEAVAVNSSGQIFAGGTTSAGTVRKLDADGTLLTSFSYGATINDMIAVPGRTPVFL